MSQFDPSAFWGIAGIVVSIFVATFFFIVGKKKTLLQYHSTTTPWITSKIVEMTGLYFTFSTTIKFINSGNQAITSNDFAEQDKLRIEVHEGKLYSYDVSKGNQKLLPQLYPVNNRTINIAFENLKPKQYFTITILHGGSLSVFGELKTGKMQEYNPNRISVFK